ncbi:FAD:protein FMN transferase [Cohnella boryungensis]|uniref:FAD:protein FMN transferase n=1 Tax=Cohnella boryungensis TaxID=768479 RepID=A0ABV8SA85_9BACL
MHAFRAMNSNIVTLGLPARCRTKSESWFAFVERNLSRFLPQSELSSLNAANGNPFVASALLYQVVEEADRYYRTTEGLFNPYLGARLERLGYSESFECLGEAKRSEPLLGAGLEGTPCLLDPAMKSIRLRPGASVDLGGIAKGWSAHQLSLMLQREDLPAGAISAGGDIAFWGTPDEGWEVGIGNPNGEGPDLLTLRLQGTMGVATSSAMKRRWADDSGQWHHHLLDPRSGTSSSSDLVQVTLLAPHPVEAEVFAKCVLILGSEAGTRWLEARHPECAAIGMTRNGSLIHCGNLARYRWKGAGSHERIS